MKNGKRQANRTDFIRYRIWVKTLRNTYLSVRFRFEVYIPALIEKGCIIVPFNGQKVVIDTQTESMGILDYFPKANKICKRKNNAWITPGLRYIVENILK